VGCVSRMVCYTVWYFCFFYMWCGVCFNVFMCCFGLQVGLLCLYLDVVV